MNPNKRQLLSCRILPELKKELQEEAAEYGMTLSSYCEWILQNRPTVDEEFVFWEEERNGLLQQIRLLEASKKAIKRLYEMKLRRFNELNSEEG